jgi:SAM-dependent methyltransferase
MINTFRYSKKRWLQQLLEVSLALRALFFVGTRHTCPCCGWRLRAFTQGGASLKVRHLGYCPRCNSKARHRRDWLFLEQRTNLFSDRLRLLHVSPKYSLSRRLKRMPNLDYVAGDLYDRGNIGLRMDLTVSPLRSDTFDAIICIHVLEHIKEDRQAMREIFRVLKSGGWALITVPIRWDQGTFEDPSITTPEERQRAFGEVDHVRSYGHDLMDRLEECGFQVQLELGKDVEQHMNNKYGLRHDEDIFYCTKT